MAPQFGINHNNAGLFISVSLFTALRFRLCGHAPSSGERLSDEQRNSTCKCPSQRTHFYDMHTVSFELLIVILSCCCFIHMYLMILSRFSPAGAQRVSSLLLWCVEGSYPNTARKAPRSSCLHWSEELRSASSLCHNFHSIHFTFAWHLPLLFPSGSLFLQRTNNPVWLMRAQRQNESK